MALPFLRILLITARKRVLYTNEPFRLLQEGCLRRVMLIVGENFTLGGSTCNYWFFMFDNF